jgi:hypothetical protein
MMKWAFKGGLYKFSGRNFIRYIKIPTDLKFTFIFGFLSFKSTFLGY